MRVASNPSIAAVLVASFFAMILSAQSPSEPAPSAQTWITEVTIISPESLDHLSTGTVILENGRILRIDRSHPAPQPPAGVTVISGKRQYLIPGLIDSHVHLASVPGMNSDQRAGKSHMLEAYYRQLPRSYLYYGYTAVVDLAVFSQKILQAVRQSPLHPDVYDCGESLPLANGYPMSFWPPAERFQQFPNFIYDPGQASSIPAEYKPEDHTPTADVARVKASGAICVKTFFERGFADNFRLPVITPEMLAETRRAGTQSGLILFMHGNSFESQKFGLAGNVDVLAHGMWHWKDRDKQFDQEPDVPAEIRSTLDQIAEKKIGYQPTIQVLEGERVYFEPDYLNSPAIGKVVPQELVAWFRSPEGQWFGKLINEDHLSDEQFRKIYDEGPLRRVRQATAYLAQKNANFVFGTDTPSGPTYGNLPGLNGYLEMQQLHHAGLSLSQIFQAATINNAHILKLDAQLGTIEPGKTANLLLLSKSPLESLDAYDSISTIFLHGQPIPRETLSANAIQ
jgi:Imidazolonepropionase and related amidohydrolases